MKLLPWAHSPTYLVYDVALSSHVMGMCDYSGFHFSFYSFYPSQVQHGWGNVPGAPELCTCLHLFPFETCVCVLL